MTKMVIARGIDSVGSTEGACQMTLQSTAAAGLASAIGRSVQLDLTKDDIGLILCTVAGKHPDAIRALAAAIEGADVDYGPVDARYDSHSFARHMRLRNAVHEALP